MNYLLGSGLKFILFAVTLPPVTFFWFRFMKKKRETIALSDPEIIFPVILMTSVLVKIFHVIIKKLM